MAKARTCSSVAMVVSPGKVVSSAPCAQPSLSASSGFGPGQQAVEEAGREAVAAAHAVEHVELARSARRRSCRRSTRRRPRSGGSWSAPRAAWSRRSSPAGASSRRRRSSRRTCSGRASTSRATSGPGMPRPFCRSSSLPTSTSTFSTMRATTSTARVGAARDLPELLAEVEVEGADGARRLGRLHALDDHLGGGRRQRREDAAAVEPAHAAARRSPSSRSRPASAGPPPRSSGCRRPPARARRSPGRSRPSPCWARARRRGRSACRTAVTPIALTRSAISVADRVVDHRGGDAGLEAEAVGQVRGAVELAAAHVDRAARGLAERDDARDRAGARAPRARRSRARPRA